jgi:dihydroorotase-like cyclic amidohydrolase
MHENGKFAASMGRFSGLQYQLPATWTEAVARYFSVDDMAQWWSRNPSLLAGLEHKGRIPPGKEAGLCWWDPSFEGEAPNEYSREYHRWKDTTYYDDNTTLRGRVLGTPRHALGSCGEVSSWLEYEYYRYGTQ